MGEVRKPGEIATQGQAISAEIVSLLETYEANKRNYSIQPLVSSLVSVAVPVLAKLGPNWAGRRIYEDWYLTRGQFFISGNLERN
jgi:hypothetical protein